jgi:quercetin dioxygenase-like cupin family protein
MEYDLNSDDSDSDLELQDPVPPPPLALLPPPNDHEVDKAGPQQESNKEVDVVMDKTEFGLLFVNGLDVVPSLRRCQSDAPASSSTRKSTTEAVWGSYNSPAGVDINVWHSIPGDEGNRRSQHEKRLLKPVSTGSTTVPSKTPEEFIQLEKELRERLLVTVNSKATQLLDGFELSHVQATRMERGTEIGRHKDKGIYGEIIATVNLVGTSTLTVGASTRTLHAGDAYALFGQARADKEHAISFAAQAPERRRFSLTFRFVPCASVDISMQRSSRSLPPLEAGCVQPLRHALKSSHQGRPAHRGLVAGASSKHCGVRVKRRHTLRSTRHW